MFSGIYSYFYPDNLEPAVVVDDRANNVDPVESKPNSALTEPAVAICKGLQDDGYQCYVRSSLNTWAGVTQDRRLTRHSKYPGSIFFEGKQLNFQDADYFVDVSNIGEVKYQIKLKGSYYPIAINEIPDPTMRNIHARVVAPFLPNNENSVGNKK